MLDTRMFQELDLVELIEDLPDYDLKKGDIGVVVEVFDAPEEAYDLEFVEESGGEPKFAYSIKPHQVRSVEKVAKETFEYGISLLNEGKLIEAEKAFRRAVDLRPDYIRVLHNSMVRSFEGVEDWGLRINAMRLVRRVSPTYEPARNNLAIAYMNLGVEKAHEGDIDSARDLFHTALGVEASEDILCDLRRNLAAAYTGLGARAHSQGRFEESLAHMGRACAFFPNEQTRHNLGLAYVFLALALLQDKEFDGAIHYFESAEDTGLILPQSLNNYGVALALKGRLNEASRAFERALEIDPENATIQGNLNRAQRDCVADFDMEKIDAAFYPAPPAQSLKYRVAA